MGKKAEEAAKSAWTEREAEEAALKLEITQLQKNLEDENKQLESTEEAIQGYIVEGEKLAESLKEAKSIAAEAKRQVADQKEQLAANNREINTFNTKCEKLTKANQQNNLKVQELDHTISKAKDDAVEARRTVENMVDKYE